MALQLPLLLLGQSNAQTKTLSRKEGAGDTAGGARQILVAEGEGNASGERGGEGRALR